MSLHQEKAGSERRQRQRISESVCQDSGQKVLVIDTDLGLRNLDVVMGLENRIVYNLVDVIAGKLPAETGFDQG